MGLDNLPSTMHLHMPSVQRPHVHRRSNQPRKTCQAEAGRRILQSLPECQRPLCRSRKPTTYGNGWPTKTNHLHRPIVVWREVHQGNIALAPKPATSHAHHFQSLCQRICSCIQRQVALQNIPKGSQSNGRTMVLPHPARHHPTICHN